MRKQSDSYSIPCLCQEDPYRPGLFVVQIMLPPPLSGFYQIDCSEEYIIDRQLQEFKARLIVQKMPDSTTVMLPAPTYPEGVKYIEVPPGWLQKYDPATARHVYDINPIAPQGPGNIGKSKLPPEQKKLGPDYLF